MDADAPTPRTWTNGSFLERYWGFLWRGLVAGLASMFLVGPTGLVILLVALIPSEIGFEFNDLGVVLLISISGLAFGSIIWSPFAALAALLATWIWTRIPGHLDRRLYRKLILLSAGIGLSIELIIAAIHLYVSAQHYIEHGFKRSFLDWETLAYYHGTGALAGLLVFLWTPEAQDYRRRRKAERMVVSRLFRTFASSGFRIGSCDL